MREEVVREEDWLGALQVRVPGEVGVAGIGGALDEDGLQVVDAAGDGSAFALEEAAEVGGDLVVAAAAGVELGAGRAGERGDTSFDGGVDVLVGRCELEGVGVEFGLGLVERGEDGGGLVVGDDADLGEGADVGAGAGDVVGGEATVEGEAFGERDEGVGGLVAEAAVPEWAGGAGPGWAGGGPWRRATVSRPRPQRRTKPAASSWRNWSAAS